MTPDPLVAATRALLAEVRPEHVKHLLVVIDEDGVRLEQRVDWIVWFRLNDLDPLASQLASWRRPGAIPVFIVGDDIAELRAFNVSPTQTNRRIT